MACSSQGPAKRPKTEPCWAFDEDSPSATLRVDCKTEAPNFDSTTNTDQDNLTPEQVEELGILRCFDPRKIAAELIEEGKTGFVYENHCNPLQNLGIFFDRYTLGEAKNPKKKPFTLSVEMVNGRFQATLTTCLSDKTYVEHHHVEATARHLVANRFFRDPEIMELCGWIPPINIRPKAGMKYEEKMACKAHGISDAVRTSIVRKRINDVLEVFHEMGYRTDIWDGNC